MDDIALRALVVGLVAAVVFTAILVMRRGDGRTVEERRRVSLDPGIYFFSSSTCGECEPARERLVSRLEGRGFVEYRWEQDVEMFSKLRIDGVPATMVVRNDRSASVQFGPVADSFPL